MASRTLIALSGLFELIGLIANDAVALNLLSATCVTDLIKQNCHDYPAIFLTPPPLKRKALSLILPQST